MTKEEKVLLNGTLCFLCKNGKILLGMKTKKIGAGYWNGYGGGIEPGETARQAAARELWEETDGVMVRPEHLEKTAIVHFHHTKSDGKTFVCKVHVFLAKRFSGKARGTDEMATPTWFDIKHLPFDQMMPADKDWLPIALRNEKIIAKVRLGPLQKTLLAPVEIRYVDSLPDE